MPPILCRSRPRAARAAGFTYLALLFWLAISGVGLAALGQAWHLDTRRAREEELLFRAGEYARALGSYKAWHRRYPSSLQQLVDDRQGTRVLRHLRQLYPDPITGSADWGLERNPAGQIQAIFSNSDAYFVRPPPGSDEAPRYREVVFPALVPARPPFGAPAAMERGADDAAGSAAVQSRLPGQSTTPLTMPR